MANRITQTSTDQYLLPTVSKLFEKPMCNRIYSFLEKYEILNMNQYHFRVKRSTILATLHAGNSESYEGKMLRSRFTLGHVQSLC